MRYLEIEIERSFSIFSLPVLKGLKLPMQSVVSNFWHYIMYSEYHIYET